jgi:phosphohistidine phosphatase
MDLILWRHAEAIEAQDPKDDLDRALTPKGERQAQRMAAWLNRQLPAGTRVLVSPARRAQQTAAALDRKFKHRAGTGARRHGGGPAACRALAGSASEPVLVVGHQPTLGLAAAWLLVAASPTLQLPGLRR